MTRAPWTSSTAVTTAPTGRVSSASPSRTPIRRRQCRPSTPASPPGTERELAFDVIAAIRFWLADDAHASLPDDAFDSHDRLLAARSLQGRRGAAEAPSVNAYLLALRCVIERGSADCGATPPPGKTLHHRALARRRQPHQSGRSAPPVLVGGPERSRTQVQGGRSTRRSAVSRAVPSSCRRGASPATGCSTTWPRPRSDTGSAARSSSP